MTTAWCPDRRLLLRMGAMGVGALSMPGAAQIVSAARGFTHGVASGEPSANSVLLWTRFVSAGGTARLSVELSDSTDFARVVAGGSVEASADHDHCAKATVTGLVPDRWYYFRFVAPDGSTSCTGRTRTLPEGSTDRFNLAVFSCSNMGFGWFNAYAHAARTADFDLSVHLGDYFYEYAPGQYPDARTTVPNRDFAPLAETIQLADYRLRFASYRADAALQRLHQVAPMVAMWDDHETANDAWSGGAQNHNPASEGDWEARKTAARRAYMEWMPVSDAPYRSYEVGDLATIALPETRLTGRMQQFDVAQIVAGQADAAAALRQFRDTAWQAADRSLLGMAQEGWLTDLMRRSTGTGTRWQILAQQVIMGEVRQPPEAANWLPASAPEFVQRRARLGTLAQMAGLPLNMDAWDGYPAARARLLSAMQGMGANLVVLTGDTHNGWAFDLGHDGRPAGVEFAGQSVTSSGFEAYIPQPPAVVAEALVRANPQLKWADTSRRGYMHVALGRDSARSQWRMWDSVRTPDAPMTQDMSHQVRHGTNQLQT